jgi:hypothetical protein
VALGVGKRERDLEDAVVERDSGEGQRSADRRRGRDAVEEAHLDVDEPADGRAARLDETAHVRAAVALADKRPIKVGNPTNSINFFMSLLSAGFERSIRDQ